MRMGVREFFSTPFSRDTFWDLVRRLSECLEKRPAEIGNTDHIFSFLPAKAGVGASTIALNAATAITRHVNEDVLLTDFDMNSGMIRFMMKLDNAYSVVDAAENAAKLDETLWPQLVSSFGHLDVLHAGRLNPNFRIEAVQIRQILDFARGIIAPSASIFRAIWKSTPLSSCRNPNGSSWSARRRSPLCTWLGKNSSICSRLIWETA